MKTAAINTHRKRGRPRDRALEILAFLINTSQSYDEIADFFGVTKQAVGHVVKRARAAGIKVRS